ncbi:MAG: ATP phosphoribosyltransferase regulatory subunit [Rhodospirillales bacterium]|nr:ATP phosphoribosyltransferase regulatory subunit [Rhodospirillales bacterium]
MSDSGSQTLLPAGVADGLPPHAAFEAAMIERMLGYFARFGYERVKPPLIEFEDSLLAGSGAALVTHTFRLMDPVSQRMLALRPDMTMQIARIATERLARQPRPLRLGYAGQVLRIKGSQLRPARQFGQVGAEIIGAATPAADAEVMLMAVEGLSHLGVGPLTIDLGIPTLVAAILAERNVDPRHRARVRAALDRKDARALTDLAPVLADDTARLLARLVTIAGPGEEVLTALAKLKLPAAPDAERSRVADVFKRVRAAAPDLSIGIDPVESRGFEYHRGVTFSLFAAGVAGELGRGGRYIAGFGGSAEPATGVTLYMDSVLRSLTPAGSDHRVFVPCAAPRAAAAALRDAGWITVCGLDVGADERLEARRLGCTHILVGAEAEALASLES